MNPMSDRMFTPACHQAVQLPLFWSLIRKFCYLLAQKGDPTLETIKCAYCGNEIKQGDEVKAEILYRCGSQIARKTNDYCSERCASYDQMAHEG
ncbi:hypothetical protein E2G14_07070 [Salmonella enterica subsp. enterica serovar Reading]|nr:hypothetical protein [Salmonella enterica subsp. enterica serovar Reading]